MLPSQLKQAISTLQTALDAHEKIAIAYFAEKLRKAGSAYPEDQTINQISLVVDKMNDSNRLFISRAEIKDLYNKLYYRSTKFPVVFAEELGIEAEKPVGPSKTAEKFEEFDIYAGGDGQLLAELQTVFDPKSSGVSKEVAKEAEKAVNLACSFPNLEPVVKTVSGDNNVVVVACTYHTPRGQSSIYVPVEMYNGTAIEPSYFTGKDGQHFISKKSIANYVEKSFEKIGSYGNVEVKSDYEELSTETKFVDFASELSSVKGLARFEHGDLVETGRRIIASKMKGFGKRSNQVKVLDADKTSITYGVSCDGLAFKVPVTVEAGKIQEPSFILCNGSLEEFSKEGLNSLQTNNTTDNQVAAVVSPLFDLKPSDLIETVRQAAGEENYSKAEDALNVLASMNNEQAYKIAFAEYSRCLSMKKEPAVEHKCSRMIKSATSIHPVCGHLNLPLHKVYQDKSGECRPLNRKGTEEQTEGASFMNSKIFF